MDIFVPLGIIVTIGSFFFNIIISAALARHSRHLKHSESFYSLCLCVIALSISSIILLRQVFGNLDPLYGVIVSLTAGIVFLFFIVVNIIHYLITRNSDDLNQKENDFSDRETIHHETIRKVFHICLFFAIIALLFIGYIVIKALYFQGSGLPGLQEAYENYWGSSDGLGMQNVNLEFGQSINLMFFFLLNTIFIMSECSRLDKWFYFPLRKMAIIGIREKEKDTVASYVYFTSGMVFAATFIYPIPLFSIIGIMCFADTAASLVGRKYGNHKILFNRKKTWEGSIGGIAVCFLVTVLLVGPIWGLMATLVFFVIDTTTPTLPISDNIGIPIAVAGIYLLLSILQVPMYSIIFSFL
ncbi:MAG: hypothetical protein ACFFD2_21460 [Promethearchaeota archaeon]